MGFPSEALSAAVGVLRDTQEKQRALRPARDTPAVDALAQKHSVLARIHSRGLGSFVLLLAKA